jgi:hypothetical protein
MPSGTARKGWRRLTAPGVLWKVDLVMAALLAFSAVEQGLGHDGHWLRWMVVEICLAGLFLYFGRYNWRDRHLRR